MKALFKLFFATLFPFFIYAQNSTVYTGISAEQVIETIVKKTGSTPVPNTVDTIKEGDPETPIKGIVTCMFATMDVLRKAVKENCNLIVTHEPLYYNHLDSTEKFENDPVYLEKKKFIIDNGLVVWRFHDYIHRIRPDGILSGMVKKLAWQDNMVKSTPNRFSFPQITLNDLLKNLKNTFPHNAFHVVGEKNLKLSNVALVPGASGTDAQIAQLRRNDVDVVIAGEVPQWETYEYVRDAVLQGRKKAIIFIGHINSEEAGMKFAADWISSFIKDMPIHFIACGSSYFTY